MKANYQDKISTPEATVSLGNLYDMNKQIMEHEPAITAVELANIKENLSLWFKNNFAQKYFMLLCNDLHDYTLFNLDKTSSWLRPPMQYIKLAVDDVIECMTNRGTLLSVEEQNDHIWELWIRNTEGCFAYYLFPYGTAVLEYGE